MNPFESIPGHPWLLALVEVLVLLVVRLHLDVDDLVEPLVRGEVPLDDLPVGDGGVGPGGEQEGPLVQLEVEVTLVLDVDVVVDDRREGDVLLVCAGDGRRGRLRDGGAHPEESHGAGRRLAELSRLDPLRRDLDSGQTETVSVRFRPKLCFSFGLSAISIFGDSDETLFWPKIHVLFHILMENFMKYLAEIDILG